MGVLIDVVKAYFESEEWSFTTLDGGGLRTGFQGENGRWTVYAFTNEEHELLMIYAVCPVTCPENKRAVMAEFITRANYGMRIGNFELDLSDGEVRYKVSLDTEGAALSTPLVRNAVLWACRTLDRYLPGVLAVVSGAATAIAAVEMIEGKKDDVPN